MEEEAPSLTATKNHSNADQGREDDGVRTRVLTGTKENFKPKMSPPRPPLSGGDTALDTPLLMALGLFVLGFVAMIAGLELLKHFSDSQQGIAFVSQDQHYLWTYGPTFILTIAVTCWWRVRYHETQQLPWKLLSKGPMPAEKSLLLDYHTPINLVALFRSTRAGHFSMSLAILGELCLRVLIIISTGLLIPKLKDFPRDTTIKLLDKFNLTRLTDEISLIDPAISVWAETQKNLPSPSWMTDEGGAIQSFVAIEGPAVNVTASVAVFDVSQECQTFSWKLPHERAAFFKLSDVAPPEDLQILSQYCSTSYENVPYHTSARSPPAPLTSFGISSGYIMNMTAFEPCPNLARQVDSHGLFATFFFGYDRAINISSLLCNQSYSITTREATTEWTTVSPGSVLSVSNVSGEAPLGLRDTNITNAILAAVGQPSEEGNIFGLLGTPWWQLMNYTGGWSEYEDVKFENATYLSKILRQTFANVASRVVKTNGVDSSHDSRGARMDYRAMRLMVETKPLRIMEVLLSLLALTAIAFMAIQRSFYRQHSTSLISLAITLSRSSDLANRLAARGRHTIKSLAANMQGVLLYLTAGGGIMMENHNVKDPSAESQSKRTRAKNSKRITTDHEDAGIFWRPFPLRLLFASILLGLSSAIIAALESMYQYSRAHSGVADVADVSEEENMKHWWRYVPTAVFVLLGMAYDSISFSLRTIHPYQELWKQQPNNAYAMTLDPFAKFGLFLLPRIIKSRFYPLAAAFLISLLSPLLPIVCSGLYTVQKVTAADSVDLGIDGWIDLPDLSQQYSGLGNGTTSAASVVNEAIQYNNLSFPQWTYDEFVFASIDLSQLQNLHLTPHVAAQARLPAVRAQANCSVLDDGYSRPYSTWQGQGNLTIRTRPPMGCRPPSNLTSSSSSPGDAKLVLSPNTTAPTTHSFLSLNSSFFGFLASPEWYVPSHGPTTKHNERSASTGDPYTSTTPTTVCNDDGLQHLFFVYGLGTVAQLEDFTVLHCMPYVSALYVDANISIDTSLRPSYVKVIDRDTDGAASPPREVPDTARLWDTQNRSRSSIGFPFMRLWHGGDMESTHHDWFFVALSTAYQGIPEAKLTAKGNINVMLERIDHLYAQLAAQYMSSEYRSHTGPSLGTNASLNAKALGTSHEFVADPIQLKVLRESYRLVQNGVSTRILEALLFVLVICGVVILWMVPTKQVLPLDPGSVAARMSLLAGSELVERLKSQNWELNTEKIGGKAMFKAESFALRWWDVNIGNGLGRSGNRRYGIDIVPPGS